MKFILQNKIGTANGKYVFERGSEVDVNVESYHKDYIRYAINDKNIVSRKEKMTHYLGREQHFVWIMRSGK